MRIDGINFSKSIPVDPMQMAGSMNLQQPGNSFGPGKTDGPGFDSELSGIGAMQGAGGTGKMEDIVSGAVEKIEAPQKDFEAKLSGYISGNEELHTVMMSAEKAKFAMNFTVKVRDKIIDAYQTIMRMQV